MAVAPGWYQDPEDATQLRWWDGSAWTDHRHPAVAGDAASTGDTTDGAPDTGAGDATGIESIEDPTATIPRGITTPAAAPSATTPPPATPPPGTSGGSDDSSGDAPKKKSKGRRVLIGLAVLIVIALVAGGAFVVLSGDDGADYTWDGAAIAEPDVAIDDADAAFSAFVEDRDGAVVDDSRCYFSLPADEDAEVPTDVADELRCGPVLFVDDDPEDGVWLSFPLEDDENDDGDVVVTVADEPTTDRPGALDDDERLSRPDDATAPEGTGGVEAPLPPMAEAGLLLREDPRLDDVDLDDTDVAIVGRSRSARVSGLGQPERIGERNSARRPAEGERFVAFEMSDGFGDSLFGTPIDQADRYGNTEATIDVDVDGERRSLLSASEEAEDGRFLISVPEAADAVDLVLAEGNVVQRVSLLTGEPGADNIAVLARQNREVTLGNSRTFPVTVTTPQGPVQDTFSVTIEAARLLYHVQASPDRVPSDPGTAFLVIRHFITAEAGDITEDDNTGLAPGHMRLRIGDETLQATNLADDPDSVLLAFEVPADFTRGRLMIGGSAESAGLTFDLGNPDFNVPIEIPAG